MIVDGQIAGSIAQGIGGALYEHLIYDADGNLSTGSLLPITPSGLWELMQQELAP